MPKLYFNVITNFIILIYRITDPDGLVPSIFVKRKIRNYLNAKYFVTYVEFVSQNQYFKIYPWYPHHLPRLTTCIKIILELEILITIYKKQIESYVGKASMLENLCS